MDDKARHDVMLLGAAVGGVVAGMIVRHRRKGQDVEIDRIVRNSFGAAGAAVGIAGRLGDGLGLTDGDERKRAVVTFATALALSLFADTIGDLIPGLDLH